MSYWQRGFWDENEVLNFTYIHLEDDKLNLMLSAIEALFLDQTVLSLIDTHRNAS